MQHGDIYGIDQLEASADGTTLVTFGHGELATWDVASGRKRRLPQPSGHEGRFDMRGLSADGAEIAATFADSGTGDLWFQRRSTFQSPLRWGEKFREVKFNCNSTYFNNSQDAPLSRT